ncbi:MAG: 2-hydroxyacyl-CoA dehydratase [Chloroflexi bacterium]|nr:2-hydroxyacyl-CoA dehydratase [Chloroflexota bacterium]
MGFDVFKEHYRDRERAAKAWQASGRQVVGYLGTDVPEEMLIAAGFLPLRITGDPTSPTPFADKYVPRNFNPLARSIFDRLLNGTYAFLDHLVIANSAEAFVRVFVYLREIKRIEPLLKLPDIYFFEFLHTQFHKNAQYNRDRIRELKTQLEQWAGTSISEETLHDALGACNANRKLLDQVAQLRSESRISGVDALALIGSSMFIPKTEHNNLLRDLLNQAGQLSPRTGARIFVEGSQLDHTWLYEIIESCNATVVAEDSDWGNRAFDTLVDETIAPLDALADRHFFKAPSPSKSTVQERVDYCVRQAVAAKAEGVIFFLLAGEDPPAWDYPEQRKALEARGIRILCLDKQPYAPSDTAELKTRIESFVQSLGAGR